MKNIILLVIVLISPTLQYEKTLLVISRPDDVRKSNSDFFHNAYYCTVVVARCPSLVVGQARESVSAAAAAGGAARRKDRPESVTLGLSASWDRYL